MIHVTIASEAEGQALNDLTQHAIGRVAQRAWMVIWSSEGVSVGESAQRWHAHPKTVRKWLGRYQRAGVDALPDQPRSGRPTTITAVDQQVIFTQINQPPWTFGYLFSIRTVVSLVAHLRDRCRWPLSRWRVREVLHRLRYRFRRPKLAPRRVDPQRDAINQAIGRTIAEATPDTVILVEDETHLRLVPLLRRMWMRIGQQVKWPAPLTNQKCSIFGVINVLTGEVVHRLYPRQRTVEMIAFLEVLLLHYAGRPILLILDQASIHKSKALRAWLALHPQIELAYLPKYAAHRDNPIEKLWWHLKGSVVANCCWSSMDQLIATVNRYFDQLTPDDVFQLVA
jgi:transposase